MRSLIFLFVIAMSFLTLFSCKKPSQPMDSKSLLLKQSELPYPVADKIPHSYSVHGITLTDDYHWMRLSDAQKESATPDSMTQKVLDYLNAENEYREKMMTHSAEFQDSLFEEIKSRIKQTDMSVPYRDNGYFYITRYEEGKEYPVYSRKKDNLNAPEEILLNVNDLAEGHSYFSVGGRSVSPDNKLLAYSEDVVSRRQYTIRIKNLETGQLLTDSITNTTGGIVWGNDNKTLFYTLKDEALRSYKIMRHQLGTSQKDDKLVYHEEDEAFSTYIYKTKSKKYLVIGSSSTLSNEYRILEADNPSGTFRLFDKRERHLEYDISHFGDHWYIRTNKDKARNFKIMQTPENATARDQWKDWMPYNQDIFITDVTPFSDFMVISVRKDGMTQLLIRPWNGSDPHYVSFQDESYTVYMSVNPDFETSVIRLDYTSMTTPSSTYDYDVTKRTFQLLKQQEVLGEFRAEDYISERKMVRAADGTMIPLSVVYKKGFKKDGTQPVLLYGYGSYGYSMDPYFSSARLSLLNRGFAFAIAHIRGGQEMGREWYENGKFLNKKNTFTDFIDCGRYLIEEKYASPQKLYAQGGSAGGLLMGAVMNMAPDLWSGIIAAVPFVDVINTMLDETIPLTVGEYDEWGNPKDKVYFDYIRSYSPYDNIQAVEYPPLLVTTGYWDSQVQYWEPAKWVAKLRAYKKDNNPILMYCNMETGHGGASGRFSRLREVAMEYTFLLDLAGKMD
jgi:oligopeptidase B